MPEMRLDHISFLVRDLDAAVEKWRGMLRILDPAQAERITYGEGVEGGEHMRWATFVKPGGTVIQLFEPLSDGFLKKVLDRHIVRVTSEDRSKLYTTLMAIPSYSTSRPPDEPEVRFMETPAGGPNAIKIWFYPGNSVGHEFIWPRDKAMQLAKATNEPVLTTKTDDESSDLTRVDAAGAETAVTTEERTAAAQPAPEPQREQPQREQVGGLATPPANPTPEPERTPAPDPDRSAAQPERAPEPAPAPRSDLPETAGLLPLLALIGLGSVVGSQLLRRVR